MSDAREKFDRLAHGFSAQEFRDHKAYFRRRARAVTAVGPQLVPGDLVLDLGCADGLFGEPLLELGLRYLGVDVSPGMIDEARRHFGDRAQFEVADIATYEPPQPVAATTCFRAIKYVPELRPFFERVASYTQKKFVFNFSQRELPRDRVVGELEAAGFGHVEVRPFLYPQHHAPPPAVDAVLRAVERGGPLLAPVLRRRGSYVVSAVPGG